MKAAHWLLGLLSVCLPSAHALAHERTVKTGQSSASAPAWLTVKGTTLTRDDGQAVVLRGVSTHGLQWFPQFANIHALGWLQGDWQVSVIRAAMYTAPEANGYIANRRLAERVHSLVRAAVKLGLYVIIDWHILSDGNPNQYRQEAVAFFQDAAKRYAQVPNVLFEICNEPNGNVSWAKDVRPYAQEVIAAIRQYAPSNIIIVGTTTWSQDVDIAAASPLPGPNIMYSLHFYAGTHQQWLRDKADYALAKRLPLFVTEWGVSEASGNGGVFAEESNRWLSFLAERQISWVNWSLSDAQESSALLTPGANPDGGWASWNLSPAGQFVKAASVRQAGSTPPPAFSNSWQRSRAAGLDDRKRCTSQPPWGRPKECSAR